MSQDKPLYVTQPSLPPLEEFLPYLERIWQTKVLTNCGPFHQELEQALSSYLGVKHVSLFSNGTNALLVALQALQITGEVITTPYSFVATANSLLWRGIAPVFVDIDPVTLNLNPARIEAAITPRTTAIMPVHCYGHPCDVERIGAVAKARGLKVIYDAAHAFAVRNPSASILEFGDLSVLSFHATKVFNTFEGGAIVSHDADTKKHIDQLRNFGFETEITVVSAGINSKMSEFNAALGLVQLKGLEEAVRRRKAIAKRYREGLARVKGIECVAETGQWTPNHAYFPVMVTPEFPLGRDALYEKLRESNIHGRRYFYPLISDFPMYKDLPSAAHANLPVACTAASRVLCLPMSANMEIADADRVIARVIEARGA
jgi:dTDP-4-amino-4,6-dideoxygalactose transaminase